MHCCMKVGPAVDSCTITRALRHGQEFTRDCMMHVDKSFKACSKSGSQATMLPRAFTVLGRSNFCGAKWAAYAASSSFLCGICNSKWSLRRCFTTSYTTSNSVAVQCDAGALKVRRPVEGAMLAKVICFNLFW